MVNMVKVFGYEDRTGSEVDVDKAVKCWQKLHFDVVKWEDKDSNVSNITYGLRAGTKALL